MLNPSNTHKFINLIFRICFTGNKYAFTGDKNFFTGTKFLCTGHSKLIYGKQNFLYGKNLNFKNIDLGNSP